MTRLSTEAIVIVNVLSSSRVHHVSLKMSHGVTDCYHSNEALLSETFTQLIKKKSLPVVTVAQSDENHSAVAQISTVSQTVVTVTLANNVNKLVSS